MLLTNTKYLGLGSSVLTTSANALSILSRGIDFPCYRSLWIGTDNTDSIWSSPWTMRNAGCFHSLHRWQNREVRSLHRCLHVRAHTQWFQDASAPSQMLPLRSEDHAGLSARASCLSPTQSKLHFRAIELQRSTIAPKPKSILVWYGQSGSR